MFDIKVIRHIYTKDPFEGAVTFHAKVTEEHIEGLDDTKVNLSRSGENPDCWFPIHKVGNHSKHTPQWHSEPDMEAYIKRVMDAINLEAEKL